MNIKLAIFGLAALGSAALVSSSASALPNGLPQANHIAGGSSHIDQVRYVCDPYGRCHWRPGYGYYGPRHHGWHHRPHYHRPHHPGPRYHGGHRHGGHHGGHHGGGHHGGHRR